MTLGVRAKGVVFALLVMLAGLWPLLVFGQPSYITDSSSYYRGGQAAWERIAAFLPEEPAPAEPPTGSAANGTDAAKQAVGVRSLVYSAATFVLSAPGTSLILLVVVQTAAAALVLWLLLRVTGATSWWSVLALPPVLALASSFPVFATLATPDLLAGLMLLCLLLLGLYWGKLTKLERLIVGLSLALSVASHASHILIAACLLGLSLLLALARRSSRFGALHFLSPAAPAAALAAGLAISFLSGLVAFGQASAVPKRYPYALARAIEDGPGKWYLEEHCPQARYAVCELFPDKFPGGVGDFLWAEGGLAQRATPEQMERIRAEEPEILSRAVAAYPWFQVQASTRNVLRQFAEIAIPPAVYQGRYMDRQGYLQPRAERPRSAEWHSRLQVLGTLLSLLILVARFSRMPLQVRTVILLTIGFIVLNNLICAILSAPDLRYQSRALWVLPALAAATLGPGRRTFRRDRYGWHYRQPFV